MKRMLLFFFLLTIISFYSVFAQDVEINLSGNTATQGLSIINSVGDTLLRIGGDGSFGLGNSKPIGFFDLDGGLVSEQAQDINIIAQSSSGNLTQAGSINIKSGWGEDYQGSINIETQHDPNSDSGPNEGDAGNINIKTATGDVTGNINLLTGSGSGISGEINLRTGFTDGISGNIKINTGNVIGENAGDVLITAGNNDSHSQLTYTSGEVIIKSGNGLTPVGGDIKLIAGSSSENSGGNIILTPGIHGINGNNGKVIVNGSGTYSGTWTQSSDERYKKNVEPLKNTISKLEKLNGVSYELKVEEYPDKNFEEGRQIGLVAQDVEKVYPELVKTDSDGYKSVAYQNLVAVLLEAIKDQQKDITDLKKEIQELKILIPKETIEVSSNIK